jgi:hypothetical protein
MTAVGLLIVIVAATWLTALVVVVHANLTQRRARRHHQWR